MLPALSLVLVLAQSDAGAHAAEPSAPPLLPIPIKPRGGLPSKENVFDPELDTNDIWVARCSGCHGRHGLGNGKKSYGARNVTSAAWQDARTDAEIREAITDGIEGTKMKAYRTKGTDAQFDALVALIRAMRR